MVDEELWDKGALFSSLNDSYVIFISPFDLFKQKREAVKKAVKKLEKKE